MPFEKLKERQSADWGAAPYEAAARTLADVHAEIVASAGPKEGRRWLDIATGTGGVALLAARAGADVTAVDFAPALIETAARLAADAGVRIEFAVADAEELPYPEGTFDVVSSSMGVIFAPDQKAVASELARVCRPGGVLAVAAWRPAGLHAEYADLMAPFRPPPLEPGGGDSDDWGREEHVRRLLGADFELELHERVSLLRAESGEAVWSLFVTAVGPVRVRVQSLPPRRQAELRHGFVELYERYRQGDGIVAPRPYLLIVGRRR